MQSIRSETSSTSSYFFIAPLQQRLIEFEGRLKKWRIFNRRSSSVTRTGAVDVPSTEIAQRRQRPVCFTSPIPRKTYCDNNNMNDPRPRPKMTWGTQRADISDEEIDERYRLIEKNSGILSIGGTIYSNVKPDQIEIMSMLGSGTCGTVHKVKLFSRIMAEKEMKRTDNKEETKRIFMDLDVIRKSNACSYIVQCYGYIITEDYLKIYMELMASCADNLLITRGNVGFPEDIIAKVALSVTHALIFLKDTLSLMHRDIKPSNILLDWHGNIKLCDFCISGQLIDSNAASMSAGCIGYLAPERTNQQPYNAQADVWSLGITLVHLAWGIFPYLRIFGQISSPFELMVKIKDTPPPRLNVADGFSPDFCTFVEQCLRREPKLRPRFNNLLELSFLVNAAQSQTDVGHWLVNQEDYHPPPGPKPQ